MNDFQNVSLPGPTATPISQPFWDSLKQGAFTLQRCNSCEGWIFYPRAHCPHCFSQSLRWEEASGRGRLKTWSIVHRPGNPAWQELAPYAVGIVELEEGPSILTHILSETHQFDYLQKVKVNMITPGDQPLPFFEVYSQEDHI